jgi:hypothetical protein
MSIEHCESCGTDAKISITDGGTRRSHHYCAQHVPVDLNQMIEEEYRRLRGPKMQQTLELARALRLKVERRECGEPVLKALSLHVLDDLIRLCERWRKPST